ncbi:MAG TPA: hypothetical protein VFJ09_13575 [Nocardioidaceae bacterium]|nr:hypothetical protein [Nocardioidaceae bacterium]
MLLAIALNLVSTAALTAVWLVAVHDRRREPGQPGGRGGPRPPRTRAGYTLAA